MESDAKRKRKRPAAAVSSKKSSENSDVSNRSPKKRPKRRKLSPEQIKRRQRQRLQRQISNILSVLLMSIVIVILIMGFFRVKFHYVSGESMEPSYHDHDYLIIDQKQSPQRYGVVTLEAPDADEIYLKRVIGMPGDLIMMEEDTLVIHPTSFELEHGEAGFRYQLNNEEVAEQIKELQQIPREMYFVVGDNVDNSKDSRSFGFVNQDQIEGNVIFRYWPLNRFGFTY